MANIIRYGLEFMLGPTEQSNTLKKLVMMRLKREPGITDTEIDDDPSSIADLFDQYHSHPETGLDGDQKTFGSTVRNNIKKYGSNVLVPPKTESEFAKIIKKQLTFSAFPLWLAMGLQLTAYGLVRDAKYLVFAPFLGAVSVISGLVAYLEGARTATLTKSFSTVEDQEYSVIRRKAGDGMEEKGDKMLVAARDLACGDIVVQLNVGVKIPADMRVLSCSRDCVVRNDPLKEDPDQERAVTDRKTDEHAMITQNLIFRNMDISVGVINKAVVLRTGNNCQIGRLLEQAAGLDSVRGSASAKIDNELEDMKTGYAKYALIFMAGVLIFTLGGGASIGDSLGITAGACIAMYPIALLILVTVCMRVALTRVVNKGVKVKEPQLLEVLGTTSVIIADKTGTLSMDDHIVSQLVYMTHDATLHTMSVGPNMDDYDTCVSQRKNVSLESLHRCAILCMSRTTCFPDHLNDKGGSTRFNADGSQKPFHSTVLNRDTGNIDRVVNWDLAKDADPVDGGILKFYYDQKDMDFRKMESVEKAQSEFPEIYHVPYAEAAGYQLSIRCMHRGADLETNNRGRIVYMKGTYEAILFRCSKIQCGNEIRVMTDEMKEQIQHKYRDMSSDGVRLLALAQSDELKLIDYSKSYPFDLRPDQYATANFPMGEFETAKVRRKEKRLAGKEGGSLLDVHPKSEQGLTFIGFIGIIDPPRKDTAKGVADCAKAGIRVIMTTSDNPYFATAFARQVGLIGPREEEETDLEVEDMNEYITHLMEQEMTEEDIANHIADVLHRDKDDIVENALHKIRDKTQADATIVVAGDQLEKEHHHFWNDKLTQFKKVVLAQAEPKHKEILVEQLQRLGHSVAVTGEHSSDVACLRAADVGIVMAGASMAAKDAADIVLDKHSFDLLMLGIAEGRLLFENLKKTVLICITSHTPQIMAYFAFLIFQIPLPLTLPMNLFVEFIVNCIPALGMAFEDPEDDILSRKPRNVFIERLLSPKLAVLGYLQIGMIAAFAGFYSYFVIMSDYGFAPHILYAAAANDNWGNYPMYCKYQGGQYVDIKGNIDETRDPMRHRPDPTYPFYHPGDGGYLVECVWPTRSLISQVGYPSDLKLGEAITYDMRAGGEKLAPVEVLDALEQNYYFEYIPWKARMSSFWKTQWLAYDIHSGPETGPGYGNQLPRESEARNLVLQDTQLIRYFRKMPMGLYSICGVDPDFSERAGFAFMTTYQKEKAVNAMKGFNSSVDSTSGCELKKSSLTTGGNVRMFKDGIFCNGDRSYDVLAKFAATGKEAAALQELADACRLLDNHPHQLRYCPDTCGHTCPQVPPEQRNVTSGVTAPYAKQCANIASRMVQNEALYMARTGFWTSVVLCQLVASICIKSRWNSITKTGMSNRFINFGVMFTALATAYMTYSPWGNKYFLQTRQLRAVHWFPGIPWAAIIFCFDETRKWVMRLTSRVDVKTGKYVVGWAEKMSHY